MASKVYFINGSLKEGEQAISEKARKLFKAADLKKCFKKHDFTTAKVHVGEAGNTTHIPAQSIKGLVDELLKLKTKPFLTDTSALYTGRRHNAIDHCILAAEHGYGTDVLGIPFIAPDGLFGTSETAVKINGRLNKEVFVAYDIARCQSILSVAHFTGHIGACAAATLKTLGMGCTSRKAKMRQHASIRPSVKKSKCTRCGQCVTHCPADAITIDDIKAHINADKCIGCGECVAVCRFDAVEYDWGIADEILQRNIAEHAMGVLKGKENRAAFFNYVISVTKDCDCFGTPNMKKVVDDIGIVASTDPVAADRAALDLVESKAGKKLPKLIGNTNLDPTYQLEHAEKIGLGSTDYKLVKVD